MKRLVAPLLAALWFLAAGVLLYVASPEAQPRHVIPSSTFAGLPAAGSIGSVANVTDSNPGVYLDNGSAHVLVASSTGNPVFLSGTSFAGTLDHSNTASRTWTLQDSTDTLVGRATADTLTNKTITAPVLAGTATGTYTLGGTPTISGPTITAPVLSGTATGTYTLAGTPTVASPTLSGTSTFTGTATSTKACATGYTRVGPNYCRNNAQGAAVTWTDAVACTARTAGPVGAPLPADANLVHLRLFWQALSNNATGQRENNVSFHPTSACGLLSGHSSFNVREEVAVVAATTLAAHWDTIIIALSATDTFHTTQLNAGGNGNAEVIEHRVQGYFD